MKHVRYMKPPPLKEGCTYLTSDAGELVKILELRGPFVKIKAQLNEFPEDVLIKDIEHAILREWVNPERVGKRECWDENIPVVWA